MAPTAETSALARAVALYDGCDRGTRWHVRIRRALSRLEAVEELAPKSGDLLEIGCGHGLFANFLALASAGRRVLGVDIDPRKLEGARRTAAPGGRVRFEAGDALAPPPGPFDAVVVVDVLYLLDEAGQAAAVAAARRVLKSGGRFVWKSQERRPRWKYALTRGQEWLATRLGLTAGASLTFLPRERALALLGAAGFKNARVVAMPGRIYTDVIYVGDA